MSDDPSPELFAIVPIPPPGTYRDTLQRDAIVTGSLDEVMEYIPQSLSRLEVEELRASIPPILEQLKLFERQKSELKDITNGVQQVMTTMADSFEKQRSLAMKRQEAARKAEGQRRVQQYLDALPDPDAPSQYPAPPLTADPRAGDEDPEGIIPPPQDPTGAVLKDADPLAPLPFGAEPTEHHREPGPIPGSRLYKGPPSVAQPISISLNEA